MLKRTKYLISASLVCISLFSGSLAPVKASADSFMDDPLYQAVAFIWGLYGDACFGYSNLNAGGPGAAIVAGLDMAVYCLCNPNVGTEKDIDVSNYFIFEGLYLDSNGDARIATICAPTSYTNESYNVSDDPVTFMSSNDFELGCTIPANSKYRIEVQIPSGQSSRYQTLALESGSMILSNRKVGATCLTGSSGGQYFKFALDFSASSASIPSLDGVQVSDKFIPNLSSYPQPVLSCCVSSYMPSGILNTANPAGYIENTLRPWVQQNYPDYEYLLPDYTEDPTETTTETGCCGCHIDYDEILSERELESILTTETYYVPELYTYPTYQLETLPTFEANPLSNYVNVGGFMANNTTDILETLGLKGLFILVAVLAVIVFIIRW